MADEELIEKLKLLTEAGLKLSTIEKEAGLPENNLSGVLKGSKKMPDRWKVKLEKFLDGLDKPSTFAYLIREREAQLVLMKSLDIPVEGATFEQLVNTVLFMAGDYKGKYEEAVKKSKEAGTKGMIPPHPKKEDFPDSLDYAVAKSNWKQKYNLQ